uniref:Uncharacterized protein n=1 Tax=Anopheles atroparvus TaxID=41427 RepID=A0A182IWT1_ANOAO
MALGCPVARPAAVSSRRPTSGPDARCLGVDLRTVGLSVLEGSLNRFWRARNCSRFQLGTRSRLLPMSVAFFDSSILRSISFTFQSLLSILPIARSKSFGFFSTTGAALPPMRCSIDRTRSLN